MSRVNREEGPKGSSGVPLCPPFYLATDPSTFLWQLGYKDNLFLEVRILTWAGPAARRWHAAHPQANKASYFQRTHPGLFW